MSATSATRPLRRLGCPPAAVVLLLATAMIVAGVRSRPVCESGPGLASEEQRPESQPCEEPQDESSGDEETASGKHAAVIGAGVSLDPPIACGAGPAETASRLAVGGLPDGPPIRGPPARG